MASSSSPKIHLFKKSAIEAGTPDASYLDPSDKLINMEGTQLRKFTIKGTIIIGLILNRENKVLLGSDTRLTHGSDAADDLANTPVMVNGVEFRDVKLHPLDNYALAQSGDFDLHDILLSEMREFKDVFSSRKLKNQLVKKMKKIVKRCPKDRRKDLAPSGVIVGMFDYEDVNVSHPRLIDLEMDYVNGETEFNDDCYPEKYCYQGDHWDELEDYLDEYYNENATEDEAIALLQNCMNIVKGTSVRQSQANPLTEVDSIGGPMRVVVIETATAEEREKGIKMVNLRFRDGDEITPAPAPPPRAPRQ